MKRIKGKQLISTRPKKARSNKFWITERGYLNLPPPKEKGG